MILMDNLKRIKEQVASFSQDVVLIAASKTQSKETLDEFMASNQDFVLGENRVQELIAKYDARYTWHLIGQLQTNKVKYVIDKVELIHSLDRIELAKEIEKQASKRGKVQNCLVEINMGAEITKCGVAPEDAIAFIKSLDVFEHICIQGVMSVLPNIADEAELDRLYANLADIYEQAKQLKQSNVNVKYFSAGMSNDYLVALKHGANMIRLGRVIFGERNTTQ